MLSSLAGWLRAGETPPLRYGYYSIVILYLCSWLFVARGYRPDARLLPLAVSAAVLGLICFRGITAWIRGGNTETTADYRPEKPTVDEPVRAGVAFLWLAGLLVTVVFIGLVPAIAVFVTGFIARYDRPRRAILVGPSTGLAVYGLFVVVLDLPGYEPLVMRLVGGVIGV